MSFEIKKDNAIRNVKMDTVESRDEDTFNVRKNPFDANPANFKDEQELGMEFLVPEQEEEIVKWLSLCPHPLHQDHLKMLVANTQLETLLKTMVAKNILREENRNFTLYQNVFQNFVKN